VPRNPIKVEDLISLLRLVDGHSRYVLFLGAGASVESGLPGASSIVQDLLRRSYAAHHNLSDANQVPESEIRDWAGKREWYQADSGESEYAKVVRHILLAPGTQEDYLRELLLAADPSLGYRHLGALVRKGIFQTIVTTNFDHLVRLGCDPVLNVPIIDMEAERWLEAGDHHPGERRLLRLNGDFSHSNLLNTGPQLDATPLRRFEALRQILRNRGLIVLGYGGNDVQLMREGFLKIWDDRNLARHGVFWCHLPGELPSHWAQTFVEAGPRDRAFFVEVQGFDETMRRFADAFGCSLPLEAQYRMQYESLSKEHALLLRLVEEWGAAGSPLAPQLRLQLLQQIANQLRLARAVLLFLGADGSFAVEAATSPDLENPSYIVSEVLRRDLVGRLQYKLWRPGDQAGDDPLWRLFPPNRKVEAFPAWDGDKLRGALVVAAEKTPVADTEQARLVTAMAQLLLRG
jgi:hypothetical protein